MRWLQGRMTRCHAVAFQGLADEGVAGNVIFSTEDGSYARRQRLSVEIDQEAAEPNSPVPGRFNLI